MEEFSQYCTVLASLDAPVHHLHDFPVNIVDGADFSLGNAVNDVPLLMLGDGGGVVVGLFQIVLVGFVDIFGQPLFQFIALLAQL